MSFTFRPAVRENVGLLIGLAGGTGSGKTYSAMRLASGISAGKPFAVIDTEAGRAKHYADQFKFDHGDLKPPFRPDAYIDAIIAADKAGYPVIVVDSMSHVWAGDGGILDWQEEELERMSGGDWQKAERVKMASWIKPKMSHKKMVAKLLQVRAHLILCFRAEEKMEMAKRNNKTVIVPKEGPTGLNGWMPVCEKSLPFELTTSFLLTAEKPGMPLPIKLQEQHKEMFPSNKHIDEDSGKRVLAWAAGGKTETVDHTVALTAALENANIPIDEFLKAANQSSLSAVNDLDRAMGWINKKSQPAASDSSDSSTNTADSALSFAEVADQIEKSTDSDVLSMAQDNIQFVNDSMQRVELINLVKKKAAQFI